MVYYDHHYEGNGGPRTYPVLKYNENWDHECYSDNMYCTSCNSYVRDIQTEFEGVSRSVCHCTDTPEWNEYNKNARPFGPFFGETFWVCGDCRKPRNDTVHMNRDYNDCGAEKHSVLHDPEDFGHWCSILDAGGDCMHMEGF